MKTIVSACLLGRNCKYNGGNNYNPQVETFVKGREVLALCPECAAGMTTPRVPVELVNGRMVNQDGLDLDAPLRQAVEDILARLDPAQVDCAVLQSRSPTCGVNQIYDGTFSGRLIPGSGIFAEALRRAGIPVIDAEDIEGGTDG